MKAKEEITKLKAMSVTDLKKELANWQEKHYSMLNKSAKDDKKDISLKSFKKLKARILTILNEKNRG